MHMLVSADWCLVVSAGTHCFIFWLLFSTFKSFGYGSDTMAPSFTLSRSLSHKKDKKN